MDSKNTHNPTDDTFTTRFADILILGMMDISRQVSQIFAKVLQKTIIRSIGL